MRYAVAVFSLLSLSACGSRHDDGRPQRVAQDESGAVLTFGRIEEVEGTRFFTLPIVREGGRGGGSLSSSGNDERNRLIVDSTTGANRQVLPDDKFEIVNWIEPKSKATDTDALTDVSGGDAGKPGDVYAAVVKRPGKNDKDRATYDVLMGHFENGEQIWVAHGLAGVQGMWLTPDHKLAMVAASAKGGIFRLYDPVSFKQLLEVPLNL